MKIYTRAGDQGETGLLGGARVPKDHPRVESYGAVDELNSSLGAARAIGLAPNLDAALRNIQQQLFHVGSELAVSADAGDSVRRRVQPLPSETIQALEEQIDRFEEELPPLRSFILPGGSPGAAALHVARTVCRRAERTLLPLRGEIRPELGAYLNRLSDLLFVMARVQNLRDGRNDVLWEKG